jgi:hypothetical protein
MKRLFSFLVAGIAALAFAGCSGELHDVESDPVMTNIIGDITAGNWASMTVNGSAATFVFTYDSSSMTSWGGGSGTVYFKLNDQNSWGHSWGNSESESDKLVMKLNGDAVTAGRGSNPGNLEVDDLQDDVEYTITATSVVGGVEVKITGTVVKIAAADLSAVNAATMAQPGAYIKIMGDSYGAADGQKFFFSQSGADYIATGYIVLPTGAANNWGGSDYSCWGKIGVGDNATVKFAEKQFNAGTTTLTNAVALNFDATNNFEVTDAASSSTEPEAFKLTVSATSSGAAIKLEPVE